MEFAWVSQEEVITKSGFWESGPTEDVPTGKYDLKISHNLPSPWSMAVHDTFNLVVNITNTNPVTNLEFDIEEMLGHVDAISFGMPHVAFGSAYQYDITKNAANNSQGKLNHLDTSLSGSGEFGQSK
jgi:hypothetical protein